MKTEKNLQLKHPSTRYNYIHRAAIPSLSIPLIAMMVLLVFPFAGMAQSEIKGLARSNNGEATPFVPVILVELLRKGEMPSMPLKTLHYSGLMRIPIPSQCWEKAVFGL